MLDHRPNPTKAFALSGEHIRIGRWNALHCSDPLRPGLIRISICWWVRIWWMVKECKIGVLKFDEWKCETTQYKRIFFIIIQFRGNSARCHGSSWHDTPHLAMPWLCPGRYLLARDSNGQRGSHFGENEGSGIWVNNGIPRVTLVRTNVYITIL